MLRTVGEKEGESLGPWNQSWTFRLPMYGLEIKSNLFLEPDAS